MEGMVRSENCKRGGNSVKLLDCTLRDGGYLNDWEFGHNNLLSIYERLVEANVDIVEVGFIDERRPFDINRSIFPNTESIKNIYGTIQKKAPITVAMIDYGTCALDSIEPCGDAWIDGIRVIFKKSLMHKAMDFCAKLKEKGYLVFSQLVATSSYTKEDIEEIAKLVNKVKPYAVSIVDTYGLMYPKDVMATFKELDSQVCSDIQIGFHAHNNLQLGYANCLALIDLKTDREIILDGTLYGMGKSAGNNPIELVAMYLNEHRGKKYCISQMLETVEESIMDQHRMTPWGYRTFFYLSSRHRCHPSWVNYFQDKNNLSITDIEQVLGNLNAEDKKLFYDSEYGDLLYKDYCKGKFTDSLDIIRLAENFSDRKLLIIGPGKNIILQREKVKAYIEREAPLSIAVNYIPNEISVDFVFITKPSRYLDMTEVLLRKKAEGCVLQTIATTNVTAKSRPFDYCFDRAPLLEQKENIIDNSFLMLLKILHRAKVKQVACAGMDGYTDREDNYFNPKMEYQFIKTEAINLNRQVRKALKELSKEMQINFVTYSHYNDNES